MTKVIERHSWKVVNPVPDWVGVWRCRQCGSLSDIGEDWDQDGHVWFPFPGEKESRISCPVCGRGMGPSEHKGLYVSEERRKAKDRRKYPTLWSRVKRRFT